MHANSIRAGLIAEPVARALRLPLVLHVRDCLPPSALTQPTAALARDPLRSGDRDLAPRRATRSTPTAVAPLLEVIDNPFDLARLDPERIDRDAARVATRRSARRQRARRSSARSRRGRGRRRRSGRWRAIRRTHRSAVLLLVGEAKFVARATRYDNRSYLRRLHELVAELGLGGAVRFLGEREDVPEILRACDVALLPSWDEPFGRAVVEAMAMGAPIVATSVGGPAEIIRDGVDGLLVAPRRPDHARGRDRRAARGLRRRRDSIAAAGRSYGGCAASARTATRPPSRGSTRGPRGAPARPRTRPGISKPLGSLH